ncbi:hypothetical protein [Deinococcus aestuarii]|uniref:hypothetical protein n=1 Tax=Deinococcus aestuarii TaxID=2774531 RepID=UPI001C0B48EF|nr:hypothetical protein [Deinococcus aestuarii]
MKRLLPALALPLLLAACGGGTPSLSGQVGMTANLTGADIESTLTITTDATTGQVTGLSIKQLSEQPTLRVVVAPASLGVTLTGIEVTVVDAAGITYSKVFRQALAERVPSGYACKATVEATQPLVPLTDQCDYSLKMPYAKTVDVANVPVIDATTTGQAAFDFASRYSDLTACPDLSLNVRLLGFDDLRREIQPIVITRAPIQETCNVL